MSLTIYALDYQFAAATDGNVNSGAGTSTFDYPPNSTKNLVISSQDGDPSPYTFDVGDTYTVSFTGNGGTTIENASVIRTDPISINGDQGWAVVFEGLDSKGDLTQVIWTPEFDLENWYWTNYGPSNPPGFYTTDASATNYAVPCFTAETPIETEHGPRPAGEIGVGDLVHTLDRGPQPVLWAARHEMRGQRAGAPVWFERGAIGNDTPIELSQHHRVLLRGTALLEPYGDNEALAPALSFLNGATIRLRPRARVTYVHLMCAHHEVIRAGGAFVETLFAGPEAMALFARLGDAPPLDLARRQTRPARPLLTRRQGEEMRAAILRETRVKRAMFGRRLPLRNAPKFTLRRAPGPGLPAFARLVETETARQEG